MDQKYICNSILRRSVPLIFISTLVKGKLLLFIIIKTDLDGVMSGAS